LDVPVDHVGVELLGPGVGTRDEADVGEVGLEVASRLEQAVEPAGIVGEIVEEDAFLGHLVRSC
jgi:hypothetical protein